MLRGYAGEMERAGISFLPPVALDDVACSPLPEKGANPQWSEPDNGRISRANPGNRACVEMIVVVVREDYDIDGRQRIEIDGGRNPSLRTSELNGGRPLAPDGVDQDIAAADLDQKAGVSHPCEGKLLRH